MKNIHRLLDSISDKHDISDAVDELIEAPSDAMRKFINRNAKISDAWKPGRQAQLKKRMSNFRNSLKKGAWKSKMATKVKDAWKFKKK